MFSCDSRLLSLGVCQNSRSGKSWEEGIKESELMNALFKLFPE